MTLTLSGATLRSVAQSLRHLAYTPSSWHGVLNHHSPTVRDQLEPVLVEMKAEGARPKLMALLLEHLADTQDSMQHERDAWRFVWSGPEPLHAKTADTLATVHQLINEARDNLLIATYNIGLSDDIQSFLEKIAGRIERKDLNHVDLFFHPIQIIERLGTDRQETISKWFNNVVWPWAGKPRAHIDQRLIQGGNTQCSQHAKVVIADAGTAWARALVTSANFSESAQRNNYEAGWLVTNPWRADQINQHFQDLVSSGQFLRINP